MGELFSLRDEKKHAYRRRLVSHIYSMSSIVKSEEYINLCTVELMKVLDEFAENNQVLDLGNYLE